MAKLDVIVCNSQIFNKSALIQIAGRVGRKIEEPTGLVLFLHEGITLPMLKARKAIIDMNQLALKRSGLMARCIQCDAKLSEMFDALNFYKNL